MQPPKLGRKMIAGMAMRLHHLITDVESYSLHSGRQRIIGYLLREQLDSTFGVVVTQDLRFNFWGEGHGRSG